jgi:hypothetical protein
MAGERRAGGAHIDAHGARELCLECFAQDVEGIVVMCVAKAAHALGGERRQLEQREQLLDAVVEVAHDRPPAHVSKSS